MKTLQKTPDAETESQVAGGTYRDGQTQRTSVRARMPSRLKIYLALLCASLCLATQSHADLVTAQEYVLRSRSGHEALSVTLEPAQRQWLQTRSELILGTSAPDYPPFDMTASGRDYEGFTADYAGLLELIEMAKRNALV